MKTKNKAEKQSSKSKLLIILDLFWTFFKLGAFTFGGGYAMIALIQKDVVERKKWISEKEMLDIVAIAESTPGAIALNAATFVGAKVAGFLGSLVTSISVMLPPIAIIIGISAVIDVFGSNQYVKWAFLGIRASVSALILNAVLKLFKAVKPSIFSYVIMALSFVVAVLSALSIIPVNVIYIIIAAAVTGVIYGYFNRKQQLKKDSMLTKPSPTPSVVTDAAPDDLESTPSAEDKSAADYKDNARDDASDSSCNNPEQNEKDNTSNSTCNNPSQDVDNITSGESSDDEEIL